MTIKQVYLGGHMLTKGSQMQRNWEKEELVKRDIPLFNPLEAPHNDKQKEAHSNDDLAERIVANDVHHIWNSDVCVIEPLPEAQGTICELGMIYAFNKWWNELDDLYQSSSDMVEFGVKVHEYMNKYPKKQTFAHMQDVRRHNVPEIGDRRSWGCNAFIYGVALALSNGKGLYEYDEIFTELEKLKGE